MMNSKNDGNNEKTAFSGCSEASPVSGEFYKKEFAKSSESLDLDTFIENLTIESKDSDTNNTKTDNLKIIWRKSLVQKQFPNTSNFQTRKSESQTAVGALNTDKCESKSKRNSSNTRKINYITSSLDRSEILGRSGSSVENNTDGKNKNSPECHKKNIPKNNQERVKILSFKNMIKNSQMKPENQDKKKIPGTGDSINTDETETSVDLENNVSLEPDRPQEKSGQNINILNSEHLASEENFKSKDSYTTEIFDLKKTMQEHERDILYYNTSSDTNNHSIDNLKSHKKLPELMVKDEVQEEKHIIDPINIPEYIKDTDTENFSLSNFNFSDDTDKNSDVRSKENSSINMKKIARNIVEKITEGQTKKKQKPSNRFVLGYGRDYIDIDTVFQINDFRYRSLYGVLMSPESRGNKLRCVTLLSNCFTSYTNTIPLGKENKNIKQKMFLNPIDNISYTADFEVNITECRLFIVKKLKWYQAPSRYVYCMCIHYLRYTHGEHIDITEAKIRNVTNNPAGGYIVDFYRNTKDGFQKIEIDDLCFVLGNGESRHYYLCENISLFLKWIVTYHLRKKNTVLRI